MDVWIFAQVKGKALTETSLEILSEARRMANPYKGCVSAVVLGDKIEPLLEELSIHGADRVFYADDEQFSGYCPETYTDLLVELLKAHEPRVLLFSSNDVTADLAPRIAAKLSVGLIANSDRLKLAEDGSLTATRLCYQRKVHTTVVCPDARPQMATVVSGVMKIQKDTRRDKGEPEFIEIAPEILSSINPAQVKVLRFIKADSRKIDISDADLIVCGGKGAGQKEQFAKIAELADLMGAAVAGSRVAVDKGSINRDRQIGQSGKSVSPELLISCGVSGANAHTVGMRDAKTVIAINTDKNAPMIKKADLGVVGDLHEILPKLNERLKKYLDEVRQQAK